MPFCYEYLPKQWQKLRHLPERTQEQEFELDIINAIQQLFHVLDAFEYKRRKITSTYDLGELLHWLRYATSTIEHAEGFFQIQKEEGKS